MLNGAYFTPSGAGASASYARASSLGAKSSSIVASMTSGAGVLNCHKNKYKKQNGLLPCILRVEP